MPGFDVANWWGVFGPAGMPSEMVNKLNKAFMEIIQDRSREKLKSLGFELTGSTPEEFKAYLEFRDQEMGRDHQKRRSRARAELNGDVGLFGGLRPLKDQPRPNAAMMRRACVRCGASSITPSTAPRPCLRFRTPR